MIFLKYLEYTDNGDDTMKRLLLLISLVLLTTVVVVNFLFTINKKDDYKYKLIINNINVRIKRNETNIIDVVPLEDYIVGVLAGEMPVSFEIEALKAQAVAARSYVLRRVLNNNDMDYDVIDTVKNQVYLDDNYLKEKWKEDYASKISKLEKAIDETKGEIVTYNGEIIDALYFSTSNGFTENSENVFTFKSPYLRSVESIWDKETSSAFNHQLIMNIDEFYNKLGLPYKSKINIEIINKSSTGRIQEIKINGRRYEGVEIRQKLGIRSTDFNIVQDKKLVYIDTLGFGHGVGMSQYGANGMALNGYNYKEILMHYYKDVLIQKN